MKTKHDGSTPHGVWIVNESDPWPDPYIAIIFREAKLLSSALKEDQKIFIRLDEALNRAHVLKEKYNAKQIRLFYSTQISIIVKSNRSKNNLSQ